LKPALGATTPAIRPKVLVGSGWRLWTFLGICGLEPAVDPEPLALETREIGLRSPGDGVCELARNHTWESTEVMEGRASEARGSGVPTPEAGVEYPRRFGLHIPRTWRSHPEIGRWVATVGA